MGKHLVFAFQYMCDKRNIERWKLIEEDELWAFCAYVYDLGHYLFLFLLLKNR